MARTGTRGSGLMLAGAALLLLSVAVLGYSRFVEWQHAVQIQAIAPPTEVLSERFEVPTPRASRSAPTRSATTP